MDCYKKSLVLDIDSQEVGNREKYNFVFWFILFVRMFGFFFQYSGFLGLNSETAVNTSEWIIITSVQSGFYLEFLCQTDR